MENPLTLVDVSYAQGVFNWDVAKDVVDGAIIRCCSYNHANNADRDASTETDTQFKRNADECTRLGIPFGLYVFSYAMNTANARLEAKHAIELAKEYKLSYPIFFDSEERSTANVAAACARAFCEEIEAAGYMAGVYASASWWRNYLKDVAPSARWVASWGSNNGQPQINYKPADTDIWQYTSYGYIAGRRVDLNLCYRDFPSELNKKNDKEEIPKEESIPEKPSDTINPSVGVEFGGNGVKHVHAQDVYTYEYEKYDDGRLVIRFSDYFNRGVGSFSGNDFYIAKRLEYPHSKWSSAPAFIDLPYISGISVRSETNCFTGCTITKAENEGANVKFSATERNIPKFYVDVELKGHWK